jgi:hypothetical protein
LSPNGTKRLLVSFPIEQSDWLANTCNEGYSQGKIVRTAVKLLMDIGWEPDED